MIQYNKRKNTYCWSKSDHIFDTRLDLRNREGKLHPDFRYLCVRRPDKPKERLELHNLSLAKFSCNACLLISIVKSLYGPCSCHKNPILLILKCQLWVHLLNRFEVLQSYILVSCRALIMCEHDYNASCVLEAMLMAVVRPTRTPGMHLFRNQYKSRTISKENKLLLQITQM